MRSIWAVAGQTLTQCLRTKIAAVFIVLLALTLGALPLIVRGGGTLAGRVQTFLAYSTSMTTLLLSVVTIFLTVSVVSSDVRDKHIFTVATKPLPRWQYVVGRWAGVVLLDAALLAAAGAVIFSVASAMRGEQALNPADRRTVETEVFVARNRIRPDPIDEQIDRALERRVADLKKEDEYENTLRAFVVKSGGSGDAGLQDMMAELRKQELEKAQSAGPGGSLSWTFSNIKTAGRHTAGRARVAAVSEEAGAIRFEAEPSLVGKLVYRGPVRINGIDARVASLAERRFDVAFSREAMARRQIADLKVGRTADLEIDPTIQITYEARPAESPPDGVLNSMWIVPNPPFYQELRSDPPRLKVTLTLSARLVDKDGRLALQYFNLPSASGRGTSVTIHRSEIALLYKVGEFWPNFVRAMLLTLVQVMFLAALGVFAGSFLSFPVGSLLCFLILPFSLAREFLTEAVRLSNVTYDPLKVFIYIGHYVFKAMAFLLPDLESTTASGALVGGMNIAWSTLGGVAGATVAARSLIVLALACLVFHRRELARVQV